MSKIMLLLMGLSCPAMSQLPAPIHLHRPAPTTQTLREQFLGERVNRYVMQGNATQGNVTAAPGYENDITTSFRPRQDKFHHLLQRHDFHYLQDLNRVDNPYLHNRWGAWGISF